MGSSRKKTTQLRTDGATSVRSSVGALWGPKQLDNLVGLDLSFEVIPEKSVLRRRREDGGNVGKQYVSRSPLASFYFDNDSDSVPLPLVQSDTCGRSYLQIYSWCWSHRDRPPIFFHQRAAVRACQGPKRDQRSLSYV